ncbi:MAG TPA: ParB/Srx family N-terminal domain-containing protein [Candidatus Saccharimonadales bacterium]|nr:ParB/Srx family N-terminal domain-containing protein [Candidatus Saccharimonadales bacterium]
MEERTVSIADLRLDGLNPRLEPTTGEREIIAALIEEQGDKLLNLADDIATHGLSPIEGVLVIQGPRSSYIVVEGNRRVAALKLLANPDLTDRAAYADRFRAIAKGKNPPTSVPIVLAPSRAEAKHWQALRHAGEMDGRGTVRWNAEAVQRFRRTPGTDADQGMRFADAIQKAFPGNTGLQDDLRTVRRERITTLGRLAKDPTYRDRGGFEITDAGLVVHHPEELIERGVARVLHDLATTHGVTEMKTKPIRRQYLASISDELPGEATYSVVGKTLASPAVPAPPPATTTRSGRPVKPPKSLFAGVSVANVGPRVQSILRELQLLDIEKNPNSAAVLTRVLLELVVTSVVEKNNWPKGSLRAMVKTCLHKIDPTGKDDRFQRVRMGLDDGTSLLSIASIQAMVHNPDVWPAPVDLRAIASGYTPFVVELNNKAK